MLADIGGYDGVALRELPLQAGHQPLRKNRVRPVSERKTAAAAPALDPCPPRRVFVAGCRIPFELLLQCREQESTIAYQRDIDLYRPELDRGQQQARPRLAVVDRRAKHGADRAPVPTLRQARSNGQL